MIKYGIRQFNRHKRFCTPGHKGCLLKNDITELQGVFPDDIIIKSQQSAAQFFKASEVRYLAGGSSMGIKAALMACNGAIAAASSCHQSIGEAARLAGKRLFLIQNEQENGIKMPLLPHQIEAALKKNPEIGTVVLAHPDYYGLNSPLKSAQAVKDADRMLFVDGAHGAHYRFREDLFNCRLFALADAYNLSAHKTLHALTQTAFLCINNPVLTQKIDINLTLLGTTSPFYPFYLSLEGAIEYGKRHADGYDRLIKYAKGLQKTIRCAQNDDPTRLVVDAGAYGLSGATLFEQLRQRHIAPEKFDERYVVFILTLADSGAALRSLKRILSRLCKKQRAF